MLKFLNPYYFTRISKNLIPALFIITILSTSFGLYLALIASPADYQQGETVRIMYIHVPASWMALGIYVFMSICSFSNLVWGTKLSYLLAISSSRIGASFALISLITGSLWGKPIWGTWWVWDARLTSMLILFLLYLSYIIITDSEDNIMRAQKPAAVIALIGAINIPVVKLSVNIWYSLHQPASVLRFGGPTIHISMLKPLMVMFFSFMLYFLLMLIMQVLTLVTQIKGKIVK